MAINRTNSVLAVLDNRAAVPNPLAAFEEAGIDTAQIWTVSGMEARSADRA